jgi:outer membrane receptor for monomeric catechols
VDHPSQLFFLPTHQCSIDVSRAVARTQGPIVYPELALWAIEVGNKWELFERHLLVTGALFQTNVSNAREAVLTPGSG